MRRSTVLGFGLSLSLISGSLAGAPRFQKWKPMREGFRHESKICQDILSHTESDYLGKFSFLTAVHETQHRVTSRARTWAYPQYKKPIEVVYCLDDQVLVFETPIRTSVSRIAREIPFALRGECYNTYLVNYDRGWENAPVMLLDEWTAYTHECMVRQELGLMDDPSSLTYGTELMVYSSVFSMLEPENTEVVDFIRWNAPRSLGLTRGHGGSEIYLERLDKPECRKVKAYIVETLGLDISGSGE